MIPEAAVEAAARALWEADYGLIHPMAAYRDDARTALEAAAPFMLADAWGSAITEAHERFMIGGSDAEELKEANPYRTAK